MRDFVQRIIFSRVVVVATGGVIAATLLWFLSPLIGYSTPLGTSVSRALAVALVPAVMGITVALNQWQQSRQNAGLADAVATSGAAVGSQEVQAVAGRLREALDTLKKSRFGKAAGRRWLYQLPWYVLIGPPGSGKTTALANSGLNFPLSDKFGRRGIGGIGGTRSCDWWFTDQAVLIDTAGRYTSQDSDPDADKTAWLGFLRLLKKYRRRQPLNGIIVAIGIGELVSSSEPAHLLHAQHVRQRITEIYAELGVRLPIYVLFTKSDLIAGFVEYFDDLGREGRESVWGITFPYDDDADPESGTLPVYAPEFDRLIGRLNDRLLERLQQESDPERRALVFGFPQQVASLKELLQGFLQEAFQPNAFEQPMLLRGVYFVSGTQVGTPFDRVMQAMSSMFGIERESAAGAVSNARSFFLQRLLREVVLGEAALVETDPRTERRRRRVALAVGVAAACIVTGGGAVFGASYFANRALVGQVQAAATDFSARAGTLQLDRVDDPDLRPVVPLLDELRNLPGGPGGQHRPSLLMSGFGLSQAGKLSSAEAEAYHKALGNLLLPRLILRLEMQMADHLGDSDFLYEALKVYLMLGHQGPLDRDFVSRWLTLDWKAAYPGTGDAELRNDLADHLRAMLAQPFPSIALNGELIGRARESLQKVPVAQRVYALIATSPDARALPPWRAFDAAGPAAGLAFVRRSGKPLTDGIPGFYTAEGFREVFLPALRTAAQAEVREDWVLGEQDAQATKASAGDDTLPALERDVTGLYLQDFGQRWDRMIGDLSIVSITDLQGAMRVLNVLSSPSSPIRLVVVSASKETQLAPPAPPPTGAAGAQDRLGHLLKAPASDPDSPAGIAEKFSDQHFQDLHSLTTVPVNSAPNAPLPIDGVISDLGGLYRVINDAPDSGSPLQTGGAGASAADRIKASAANLPQPVQGWVLGVSRSSASMSIGGAREKLLAQWRQSVGPACQAAIRDHYPFQAGATQDISLREFAQVFSAGGTLDSFFNDNLRAYVDTGVRPWRWRGGSSGDFGLGTAPLRQFERAAEIRDSYFVGTTPNVGFTLTPTALDGTAAVTLTTDGQTVSYDGRTPTQVRLQWPGLAGSTGAKVVFAAKANEDGSGPMVSGPWAWFHLLDQGHLRSSGAPGTFSLDFSNGGDRATFTVRAEGSADPFTGTLVREFRCPWSQP